MTNDNHVISKQILTFLTQSSSGLNSRFKNYILGQNRWFCFSTVEDCEFWLPD